MDMTKFLRQHQEAAEVVKQIESKMGAGVPAHADEIRSLLSGLVGKLKIHLSLEDKDLYPKALGSSDAALKQIGARLQKEMSGLAGALLDYSNKWTASAIKATPDAFVTETKGVVAALKKRIEVEEKEFYPLCAKV